MIDTFKLVEDLKSRINPAYANQIGTESHERAQCVAALEQLQVELMAKQQHLSGAFSQLQEAEKEAEELREQLAQERKRLEWVLYHDAMFYPLNGVWGLHWTTSHGVKKMIETDSPRPTIDELIAAEAAGGGK